MKDFRIPSCNVRNTNAKPVAGKVTYARGMTLPEPPECSHIKYLNRSVKIGSNKFPGGEIAEN